MYERDRLCAGHRIDGPAVIEEMSSTTVLGPQHHAEVDTYGNLLVMLAPAAQADAIAPAGTQQHNIAREPQHAL
ncbi:hypothetical protein D9M72_494080 [compost metagenome]